MPARASPSMLSYRLLAPGEPEGRPTDYRGYNCFRLLAVASSSSCPPAFSMHALNMDRVVATLTTPPAPAAIYGVLSWVSRMHPSRCESETPRYPRSVVF